MGNFSGSCKIVVFVGKTGTWFIPVGIAVISCNLP
jgi:hypothetical protein